MVREARKRDPNCCRFCRLIVSIAFMLIADIDSPRHGIIRVRPQNLISLAESLPPPSGVP